MGYKPLAFVVVLTVLTGAVVGAGCPASTDSTGDLTSTDSTTKEMILVHAGVDFSADAVGDAIVDPNNNRDGETIAWPPSPNTWYYSDTDVWFRPTANTDQASFTKDMGAVTLSSVTTVPTTWDGGVDQDLPALQVDHVYVVKCLDGYAKFLVKAIRTDPDWEADVEYVFSTGDTLGG